MFIFYWNKKIVVDLEFIRSLLHDGRSLSYDIKKKVKKKLNKNLTLKKKKQRRKRANEEIQCKLMCEFSFFLIYSIIAIMMATEII